MNSDNFSKIKVLSNLNCFKILSLVIDSEKTITMIGQELKLSYSRTKELIGRLNDENLISKRKEGRNVYVKAKYKINFEKI